jgi:hypothetical protein
VERAGQAAERPHVSRVFARIDVEAFNAAVHGYLDGPVPAGLLPQAAADGKIVRGAVRPDGSQVHLLSVFDVSSGRTRAQREVDA